MTEGLLLFLRSRRLALVLLTATAALASFGTLPLSDALRGRLASLPGILAVARTLGLVDTYRSPLFVFLLVALGVNIVVCTWHRLFVVPGGPAAAAAGVRRHTRRILDALVHLSLLAIVAGGVAKGLFGFVRTQNIYVGHSTDVFYDFGRDADVPLGFRLEVLDREDTFYPLQARIGVSDRASGRKIDLLELRAGKPAELPGGGLELTLEEPDEAANLLRLRTTADGRNGTTEWEMAAGGESLVADVESFSLTLVAWKREIKGVRSRVACRANGVPIQEGWISPQGKLTCRGVSFAQTAYGADEYGKPFVGVQAVREPAAPLFWGGCIVFALALPLFQIVRKDRRFRPPAAGDGAGVSQNRA